MPKSSARKRNGRRREGAKKSLLSLMEVGRRTGISYPTLVRYVKVYGDRIPHVGSGRKRRFPARAVAIFAQLRSQSRRGRRPQGQGAGGGAALEGRLARLEKGQKALARSVRAILRALKKPLRVSVRR
jgi:hypothetical protein